MTAYHILLHPRTWQKVETYLLELHHGRRPGGYLQRQLAQADPQTLGTHDLLVLLLQTKKPQIYAESAVRGDGSDWNLKELGILGDISMALPVTVFDNGRHAQPEVHTQPFAATLVFTPGTLLRNGFGLPAADAGEVVRNHRIDAQAYRALYHRRLLPVFHYINHQAKHNGTPAFITMPGLGCGQFAGPFKGRLGEELKQTLFAFLSTHGRMFDHIQAVYYDPYNECANERQRIGSIEVMVRPLCKGNHSKPQLCPPGRYAEPGDPFAGADLYSIVAWDHVSWPGNDFYTGCRATDDGVKAAATNAMAVMTGVQGRYDTQTCCYRPPTGFRTWLDVVQQNNLQLHARENLQILPASGGQAIDAG